MAKKEAGGKSSQQNDFLQPLAPENVTAADVGTNRPFNDGAATVSFTLPVNSQPATSYMVTATASGQTTRTATGSSSPLTVTGLASSVTYTVTVTAENTYGTSDPSTSTTVTATTVPATPTAPTVTSTTVNQDVLSWTAPNNGGSSITGYYWESDDNKSGTVNANTTQVTVAQEGGTSQKYRVRATNGNGDGEFSPYSNTITTVAPFFPFFPGFGPYFPPFFPFFPPSFPSPSSLGATTYVLTINGYKTAETLEVGDKLVSLDISEIPLDGTKLNLDQWSSETFTNNGTVETEIVSITSNTRVITMVQINKDWFTDNHFILTRKNGQHRFVQAIDVDESFDVYDYNATDWLPVSSKNVIEGQENTIYTIDCEPYDIFFTENALVYNIREDL